MGLKAHSVCLKYTNKICMRNLKCTLAQTFLFLATNSYFIIAHNLWLQEGNVFSLFVCSQGGTPDSLSVSGGGGPLDTVPMYPGIPPGQDRGNPHLPPGYWHPQTPYTTGATPDEVHHKIFFCIFTN